MDRPFDDPAILETSRKEDVIVISKRRSIAASSTCVLPVARSNLRTG